MPRIDRYVVHIIDEADIVRFQYRQTLYTVIKNHCKLTHNSKVELEPDRCNIWIRKETNKILTSLLYLRRLENDGTYSDKRDFPDMSIFMKEQWSGQKGR